jgi:hypothetical protein
MHNLSKAYGLCKDEEFVTYMKRKWSDHEDGTKVLNSQELMEFALKKYQTSVEEHTWGVDSKNTKTIMTLASKVGNIQKWQSAADKQKNDKDDDRTHLSAAEYRKKRYNDAPAWMKKAPTDGKKKKNHKGVEYTWCKFHKMWVKHDESTCRINPAYKRTNSDSKSTTSTATTVKTNNTNENKSSTSTVKFNRPHTMVAEVHDSDDDDDSTSDI